MSDLIIILGDRGGGKTLAAVRRMVLRQRKCKALAYTNFPVKKIKHVMLDEHSFIKEVPQEKGKDKLEVNWDYWREIIEKHKKSGQPFDIYIDEAHNVVSSRNSMSKKSQLYSDWIAQLRKILGENAGNTCCIISQTLKKIDVNFRDLADYVMKCNKYKLKDNTRVDCLTGEYAIEFGFIDKKYQDIGQSLYYAIETNRKPAIATIIETDNYNKHLTILKTVCEAYDIKLIIINEMRN